MKIPFILVILSETYFCYKILVVISFPRTSHCILGKGIVRHLLEAGHEVTYITPVSLNTNNSRLRQIDVSSIDDFDVVVQNYNLKHFIETQERHEYSNRVRRENIFLPPVNLTIFHENVQKLIHDPNEKFDAVVAEWSYVDLAGCGLAAVFNCPFIWATTSETTINTLGLIQGSMNPAYTLSSRQDEDPPFPFWKRLVNLYYFCEYHVDHWLSNSQDEELYKKAFGDAVAKRGRVLPPYHEARRNASMILANSFVSTGTAMTLPQNYKQIGGYHIEDHMIPLPKNLQTIMDNSKHGVIYFSLGSIIQTYNTPEHIKTGLMNVFGEFKQTVVWKFDSNFTDVTKNVLLVKWAPQHSILAHKNCKLFITHGGLLSMTEAIHAGVPIIGIPLFADQFINVRRAVDKGFGKAVSLSMNLARDLKAAIEDVIGNRSYTEKAKEYSWIHKHRLVPPGRELVFWVEQVARSRGAAHLRPRACALPLYHTLYLDFLLLLLVIFYAMARGIWYLCRFVKAFRKLKTI